MDAVVGRLGVGFTPEEWETLLAGQFVKEGFSLSTFPHSFEDSFQIVGSGQAVVVDDCVAELDEDRRVGPRSGSLSAQRVPAEGAVLIDSVLYDCGGSLGKFEDYYSSCFEREAVDVSVPSRLVAALACFACCCVAWG